MELMQAKRAVEILSEIEKIEKQIELFNNTKEFCSVQFNGENGDEKEYRFSISGDKELIQSIRTLVADKLKEKIEKLMSELSEL